MPSATPDPSAGADRQWAFNRLNFEGRWQGTSHWYLRSAQTAGGPLAFAKPDRLIDDTCYAITFTDADTGVWDGSGLLFAPEGRRRLPLSRRTYNQGGFCWQFAGAGGQSSLAVEAQAPRFGHEINHFHGRSRSMLVLLWDRQAADLPGPWRLSAVGAVAFRCALSAAPEPPRSTAAAEELLALVEGWPGREEVLEPGLWPAQDPGPQPAPPFRAAAFRAAGRCVALADRQLFAVPEELPPGGFRLESGCLLTPRLFQQISLRFDADQRLSRIERRRFRPAGG
ncbi:MAG: hypothetical protein ACKO0M_03390 [Cyanobium sp.]